MDHFFVYSLTMMMEPNPLLAMRVMEQVSFFRLVSAWSWVVFKFTRVLLCVFVMLLTFDLSC